MPFPKFMGKKKKKAKGSDDDEEKDAYLRPEKGKKLPPWLGKGKKKKKKK